MHRSEDVAAMTTDLRLRQPWKLLIAEDMQRDPLVTAPAGASVNSDSPCGSKSIPTVCTPGKARTASTALIMQRQQLSPRTP